MAPSEIAIVVWRALLNPVEYVNKRAGKTQTQANRYRQAARQVGTDPFATQTSLMRQVFMAKV